MKEERKGLGTGRRSCDRLRSFVESLYSGIRDEYKMLREVGAIPMSKNYDPEPKRPCVFT